MAGGNAAGPSSPFFCLDCSFQNSKTLGYQNEDGLSTSPSKLIIFENSCPSTLLLSNSTFTLKLRLLDNFSTFVSGPILTFEGYFVQAELFSGNCPLFGSTKAPFGKNGVAFLENLQLFSKWRKLYNSNFRF